MTIRFTPNMPDEVDGIRGWYRRSVIHEQLLVDTGEPDAAQELRRLHGPARRYAADWLGYPAWLA